MSDATGEADDPEALLAAKRYDDAADAARRLIARYPSDAHGYVLMARILNGSGNADKAEEQAARAVELDDTAFDAHLLLAQIRNSIKGRATEAEAAARRAIELRPTDWRAHNELADSFRSRRMWADSEEPQRAYLEFAPNKVIPRLQLSFVLARLSRPEEAAVQFDITLASGLNANQLGLGASFMESCGLAPPLKAVYRAYSRALGRPDLSEPGTAGDDPKLLAEQAKVALRLSMPLTEDDTIARAARDRARELANLVMAADPDNETARKALENILNRGELPQHFILNPDLGRPVFEALRANAARIRAAGRKVDDSDSDGYFEILEAMHEGRALFLKYDMREGAATQAGLIEDQIQELRKKLADAPEARTALAARLSSAGLAAAYPEFHYWLLTGAANDVGARLGSVENTSVADDDETEGGKLS